MDIDEKKRQFAEKFNIPIDEFYKPPEPTENFLLEMAADHELRICELELFGGTE